MSKTVDIPIVLESVEISNFRLFGELTVALHPQLTVFIAPNSGGKTALLDAVAGTLKGFFTHSNTGFRKSDVKKNAISYTSEKLEILNAIKLQLTVNPSYINSFTDKKTINSIEVFSTLSQNLNNRNNYNNSQHAHQFNHLIKTTLASDDKTALPLLAYFSANRRTIAASSVNSFQAFDLSREQAYRGLLPCSDLNDFAPWLRERAITGLEERLEMEENGEKGKPTPDAHLKAVSTVLASMLNKEVQVKTVKYFSSSKSIQAVKENGERFDIDQLSHGAKSVLTIAAKLAMHCCALNPHLRDQAPALTPGIILIDEIDLHLHPRWQQHVIADLQQCFPKMQFIISTHSPAVLSTVKKENIRVIEVDHATGESSATELLTRSYGASIADTLETIMGVTARPDNALVRTIND